MRKQQLRIASGGPFARVSTNENLGAADKVVSFGSAGKIKKLLVASPSNFFGGALLSMLLKLSNERFLLLFERTTVQESGCDSSACFDSSAGWESLLPSFSSGSETGDVDAFR